MQDLLALEETRCSALLEPFRRMHRVAAIHAQLGIFVFRQKKIRSRVLQEALHFLIKCNVCHANWALGLVLVHRGALTVHQEKLSLQTNLSAQSVQLEVFALQAKSQVYVPQGHFQMDLLLLVVIVQRERFLIAMRVSVPRL